MAKYRPTRSYLLLIILLILSLTGNLFSFIRFQSEYVVTQIIDGDSFELANGQRVRLMGVDAPELGRCGANEAKEKLSSLILNRHVRLKHALTDDFGRWVAIVIVEDWKSWINYLKKTSDPLVNRALVRTGLAIVTGAPKDYQKTINQASKLARNERIGIYSPTCRQTESKTSCKIKGNIRNREKIYYLPTCKAYKQVFVDLSFGDTWFCREAEAQKAGFDKASLCK